MLSAPSSFRGGRAPATGATVLPMSGPDVGRCEGLTGRVSAYGFRRGATVQPVKSLTRGSGAGSLLVRYVLSCHMVTALLRCHVESVRGCLCTLACASVGLCPILYACVRWGVGAESRMSVRVVL